MAAPWTRPVLFFVNLAPPPQGQETHAPIMAASGISAKITGSIFVIVGNPLGVLRDETCKVRGSCIAD